MKKMEHGNKKGLLLIPLFIGAIFLFTWVVMLLWNAILPAVTGVKAISFFQAMGILILSKILFGFNKGWGGRQRHYEWKNRMAEKLKDMTPEEREKFKAEWRNRCGSRWTSRFEKTETPSPSPEQSRSEG